MWCNAYGSGYTLRPDVSINAVMSGLETACWDICGKAVGKPVYDLLGGQVQPKLRSYTYLYPDEADGLEIDEAAEPRPGPESRSLFSRIT